MIKKRIQIDFNEILNDDLYLLSSTDERVDSDNNVIQLFEGLKVNVYMDDYGEDGTSDPLVASGTVELNKDTGWSSHVKWCVRIDKKGINHLSELET